MPPKYKHLSQRNQILKRPGQHIGSTKNSEKSVWLVQNEYLDGVEHERIIEQVVNYNPGLIHIFYEVLSNAQDNYFRSAKTATPLKKIEVSINDEGLVTVWNDGLCIPTRVHEWSEEEEQLEGTFYEAELIFGHLNSSENYDDLDEKRVGAGLHGVGVKLTNIFSSEFSVETFDPETGKKFFCKWTGNMETHTKPKITTLKQTKGYTKVSYKADFARFGLEGYSPDLLAVVKKLCIDCAMVTGVKVIFNGEKVPVKDLLSYSNFYTSSSERVEFKSDDTAVVLCEKPEYETGLSQISFVNGVLTSKGGVHVDNWLNGILKPLLEKIKIKFAPKDKGSKPLKLTVKNLHNYFILFVRCNLENPEFEGQTKQVLIGSDPAVKVNVTTAKLNQIMKWGFLADIEETIKLQSMKELKKTDGKKETHVSIPKADDANNAGKKNSSQCTLFITEGLSAKTFAVTGISAIENGRDWYGVLPVRGKVLNVRGASAAQINANKEITALKKMLGLQHGVDYSDDAEFKRLRYGRVQILTDADADGDHIKGLLINFFKRFYPSLVARGYLTSLRTPIVKALQGKKVTAFYYLKDFKTWASKQKVPFKAKYYKGLGSSADQEIREIFQDPRYVNFIDDASADDAVDMIFSSKRANDRKKWLEAYQEQEFVYEQKKDAEIVPITKFFNNEMISFSIYDNQRSIPSVVDGQKPSQRKALYVALHKLSGESKVEQFAAQVAKETEYHHGGTSMEKAIIGLAQTFVGSNNIAMLKEAGQLGSRLAGGEDAASPRYVFVGLPKITRYVFRKEDDPILEYLEEEGKQIEPRFFVPVLPMLLVNGAKGIGTGYSTDVPCYNPVELVNWIKDWLEHERQAAKPYEDYIDLTPWYWGFTGVTEKDGKQVHYYGEVENCGTDCYQISELPVKVWTDDYKAHLDALKTGKKVDAKGNVSKCPVLVSKWEDQTTFLQAKFKVWTKPGVVLDYSKAAFRLSSTESLNNMTAFTSRGGLHRYSDIEEILREFCKVRLEYYQRRKKHLLAVHSETLKALEAKKRFITEVRANNKLLKSSKQALLDYLEAGKYYKKEGNYKYLTGVPFNSFTVEKVAKLLAEINGIKAESQFIKKTSPAEMWNKELDEFLVAYREWKTEIEEMREKILKTKIRRKK